MISLSGNSFRRAGANLRLGTNQRPPRRRANAGVGLSGLRVGAAKEAGLIVSRHPSITNSASRSLQRRTSVRDWTVGAGRQPESANFVSAPNDSTHEGSGDWIVRLNEDGRKRLAKVRGAAAPSWPRAARREVVFSQRTMAPPWITLRIRPVRPNIFRP